MARRIWITLVVLMACQRSYGGVMGFAESFKGTGEYALFGDQGAADNPGWYGSLNGETTGDGYQFFIPPGNSPDDTIVYNLFREVGTGSFREMLLVDNLDLGEWPQRDNVSTALALLYYDNARPTTSMAGIVLSESWILPDSETWQLIGGANGVEERHVVRRGSEVVLGIEYQSDSQEFVIQLDYLEDEQPPTEVTRVDAKHAFNCPCWTKVSAEVSGGPPSQAGGTVRAWTMVNAETSVVGDYDGNGQLDAADLRFIAVSEPIHDQFFDLNADGDINMNDTFYWLHELKHTYIGDSDLDGEFNSADLINVFQSGDYEDGVFGNSTWSTGDWNGDGDFTTDDLVLAFQDGGYEMGARAVSQPVPEGTALGPVVIAWLSMTRRRRLENKNR